MAGPDNATAAAVLRLSVPCDHGQVRGAVQQTRRFLTEQGCAEKEIMDCELALTEACNNAFEYATPQGRSQPFLVETTCWPCEIEMRITDQTAGFEWPQTPHLPGPESEHGRGLYLIRTLMEHSEYNRGATSNVLVLRKRRYA